MKNPIGILNDPEILTLLPDLDQASIAPYSQKRVVRFGENCATAAAIHSIRVINQGKLAIVAAVCQAQIEETVTALVQRNPTASNARNLMEISHSFTKYACNLIEHEQPNNFWR